jgi:hypothetical protein
MAGSFSTQAHVLRYILDLLLDARRQELLSLRLKRLGGRRALDGRARQDLSTVLLAQSPVFLRLRSIEQRPRHPRGARAYIAATVR